MWLRDHDGVMAWSEPELDRRTKEVLIDAYNEDEQLGSFECTMDELLGKPVECEVLGRAATLLSVTAAGVFLGLRATLRLDGVHVETSLVDVELGSAAPTDLALTIAAYKRWVRAP